MPDRNPPVANARPEPLALAGIGCRFPGGVRNVESFWKLLTAGRSAITEVPADRWNAGRYFHAGPEASGRMVTRWGGFVDQLKAFDAAFWGISPREASRMDPQQRWLLETAWEALEDAGIPPSNLRGSNTGVFVGISSNDYGSLQLSDYPRIDLHTNSGGTMSIAANRISYQFDFKGPSIAIDTACSSALVAVSQACQAIWSGECGAALAGGVNALITPHSSVGFSKANMLSPSGKCFAFDARADGYVRGEGVGLIFLKPLARALEDRDRIYAVIRSAVVNQDGHSSTMTVPSVESQSEMLRRAYSAADVPPHRVSYVEAHGTGTPVGDPIEALALGRVLGAGREPGESCAIGSVKTNLGHLESASGAAGLIKAALILERGSIPPSLNFETPNPDIPFDDLKLRVPTELEPIPPDNGTPPVASVNSFGFGGTNAHVVLEGGPASAGAARNKKKPAVRPFVLPISARDDFSLRESAKAFRKLLDDESLELADLCASAGARKEHHAHRLVFLGEDAAQLRHRIGRWLHDEEAPKGVVAGSADGETRGVVFVFTGQGAQWWAMGRQLLEREPVFRRAIRKIDKLLQPLAGWSLNDELTRPANESRINHTSVAQPAIFALQIGLVELWKSWGIEPEAVAGHSVGEVAAACCAGVFSLEEAVKIVFERSRLQETAGGRGRMLAAGLSAREARGFIRQWAGQVDVAAINSPDLVTLAGDSGPMEEIGERLESEGRFTRWLPVDYAFHTHQMDPIREELLAALAQIRPRPGKIPFVSTVTGDAISSEKMDAIYWWRNVRQPVLFASAISRLTERGHCPFLEIGPHPALQSSLSQCLSVQGNRSGVFHSLRHSTDESEEMLSQLASLHIAGTDVDWAAVNQSTGIPVRLPHYSWHYQSHWLDEGDMASRLLPETHPFLGKRIPAAKPTWQCELDLERFRYLRDHRVWNSVIFPASGYAEIGLALARELFPEDPYVVEDIESLKALFIPENELRLLQITFEPADQTFCIHSATRENQVWELNARGRLVLLTKELAEPTCANLEELRRRMPSRIGHEQYYAEFHAIGYQFGPDFCLVETLYRAEGESLAEIPVPAADRELNGTHRFHPSLMDACFQSTRGLRSVPQGAIPEDYFFLPETIRRIQIHSESLPDRLWAHAVQLKGDDSSLSADIFVYDDHGQRVAEILGFRASRMDQKRSVADIDSCLYQFRWKTAESEAGNLQVASGNCLILAEEDGVPNALSELIETAGGTAIQVHVGAQFEKVSPTQFSVAADSRADLQRVLGALSENGLAPDSIVHCWSLGIPGAESPDADQRWNSQTAGVRSALHLSHALGHLKFEKPARIYFVTRHSQAVIENDPIHGIASAPPSGFARVANNEQPEHRWTIIDLEDGSPETEARLLFQEVASNSPDLEVAFRNGDRFIIELHRTTLAALPDRRQTEAENVPFRLQTAQAGLLAKLSLNETQRREPDPGEIEVLVKAGGVNFRDVMKALGVYPGNPVDLLWFGDDFAGTVLRVGKDVTGLEPGDRVAGIAPYCFRSHVTADHRLVFKLPPDMSFEEAATLPTVFLTAHHALVQLADLQPGERVLIHAGSGGVGQAAIQIAQNLGLEIFATAGSAKKRQVLSDMGVPHVLNSRTLEFADEILKLTEGEGVDAVLNSLAGPFIPKSLSVLAPFGHFLEIGKIDVYGKSKIGMESLKDNISYSVIDLAQQLERRPMRVAAMFETLSQRFAAGDFRPLPRSVFPVSEVADAFRFMARGKHIGKVVLSFETERPIEIGPSTEDGRLFRPDAAYLVSGGAGGFGWAVAKWMAEQGARTVILMSRSGPSDQVQCEIETLRATGINFVDVRCDVARPESLAAAIDAIRRDLPPLRGIVHAAMVLEDEFIARLDDERFDRAMKPKILGAWNLHDATRGLPLDHFICFSSISSIVGGPRQSNYNAGNAFLDAFAHYRRSRGLPALSINWGALSGTGFVERDQRTADYLEKTGFESFRVSEALRILKELILRDPGSIAAARVDWQKLGRFNSLVNTSPAYSLVAHDPSSDPSGQTIRVHILSTPGDMRQEIVEDFLAKKVAGILGVDAEQVDRAAAITNLGLDSLMAVELINSLERDLGMNVPMGNVMSGPSVVELTQVILAMLQNDEAAKPVFLPGKVVDGLPATEMEQRSLEFWMNELEGAPAGFCWPGFRDTGKRGRVKSGFDVDDELAHQIILLAAEQEIPPESVMIAAFEVFLHRLSGESELLIGISPTGPSSIPIPLRSRATGDSAFLDFLARAHEGRTSAGRFPFPEAALLAHRIGVSDDAAMGLLHRVEIDLATERIDTAGSPPHSDLKLSAQLIDGEISGTWDGDARLFDNDAIERFDEIFRGTLERIVRNPDQRISDLNPLNTEEKARVNAGGNENPRPLIRFRKEAQSPRADFLADAVLDSSIHPGGKIKVDPDRPSRLFLTGGTGFVGAFLLDELLKRTDAEIFCLVRAKTETEGLNRLRTNLDRYHLEATGFDQRVNPVVGDLSKPLLGLSKDRFDQLPGEIDAIYHNGAEVNLVLPYESLRQVNVNGTREILRLACHGARAIPVHAVSTFTVHTTDDNRGQVITEDDPLPPCESLLYGYSQTKWVSEALFEEARHRGLPVSIYRPGHITGDSRSGISNASDLLHTMLLVCWQLGAAPLRDSEFDVTPVDFVARAIVSLSLRKEALGRNFLLTNPNPLKTREFAEWIRQQQLGVEAVSYDDWRTQLLEIARLSRSDEIRPLVEILAPRALADDSATAVHPRFNSDLTSRFLKDSGLVCPPAGPTLLSTYLKFLQSRQDDMISPMAEAIS